MQHLSSTACLLTLIGLLFSGAAQAEDQVKDSPKVLRHMVLFQFKEGATPEQIQEVVDAFAALRKKIDAIHDFEWGTDVSVENKAEGFTHGFLVTFRTKEGRDAYLPHPEHQKFVQLAGPRIGKALVFDYWTKE